MRVPLDPSSLRRLRYSLHGGLSSVPASHVAEALAAATELGSAIALKHVERDAQPGASAELSEGRFIHRLAELGHTVEAAHISSLISAIAIREAQTRGTLAVTPDHEEAVAFYGFAPIQIEQLRHLSAKPFGIVAVGGPAGSGRSTCIRQMLAIEHKNGRNAVLIDEDWQQEAFNGISVLAPPESFQDPAKRAAAQTALSRRLREDPDMIAISDLNSKESFNLAFVAAMTGHQVPVGLSATGAGDVLDGFTRRGIEHYKRRDHTLIAGLVGTNLLRTLCPHCALTMEKAVRLGIVEPALVAEVGRIGGRLAPGVRVARPNGCASCERRGFVGREAVGEVMVTDRRFLDLWADEDRKGAISHWKSALGGMEKGEIALAKMFSGRLDPREVEDKLGDLQDLDADRLPLILNAIANRS